MTKEEQIDRLTIYMARACRALVNDTHEGAQSVLGGIACDLDDLRNASDPPEPSAFEDYMATKSSTFKNSKNSRRQNLKAGWNACVDEALHAIPVSNDGLLGRIRSILLALKEPGND